MARRSTTSTGTLRRRLDRARDAGKLGDALRFAAEIAEAEPTEANRELHRRLILERAAQLNASGQRDAARDLLRGSLEQPTPIDFRADVAAILIGMGGVADAHRIVADAAEGSDRGRIVAKIVDAAIVKGPTGRDDVPVEHQAAFDAILAAGAAIADGRDDLARDHLQAVGLTSPLLEWKLFLRGLSAYYQHDDARAVENWQRLTAGREPWRLASPYRAVVDRDFRAAQTPEARRRLDAIVCETVQDPAIASLVALANRPNHWNDDKSLKDNIVAAKKTYRLLEKTHRDLADRLARFVYAMVAKHGHLRNVNLYKKNFPLPADDPSGARLLANQRRDDMNLPDIVAALQTYQAEIADMPDRFPGDEANLARALIWEKIADIMEDAEVRFKSIPPSVPRTLDSLRNSIALVPNRLVPHERLFDFLERTADNSPERMKQAVEAATNLLARFPDHARCWRFVGEHFRKTDRPQEALAAFRRALRADPMLPGVRRRIADLLWVEAVVASSGKTPMQDVRPMFEESLRMTEGNPIGRYAAWAMVEAARGETETAERLIADLRQPRNPPGAVALALFLASRDVKAAAAAQARHKAQWEAAAATGLSGDDVVAAFEVLAAFDRKGFRNRVQIVKAILPLVADSVLERFSEHQLVAIGRQLIKLKELRSAWEVARHAEARFPRSVEVVLLAFDVEASEKRQARSILRSKLQTARSNVAHLPAERRQAVLEEIDRREKESGLVPDVSFLGLDSIDLGDFDDIDIDDIDFDNVDFGKFRDFFGF